MSNAIPEYPVSAAAEFRAIQHDRLAGARLSRRASLLVIAGFSVAGWLAIGLALRNLIG